MRLLSNTIKGRGVVFGVVVICLFGSAAFGQPWDGNGVEGDPYLIYDACDMETLRADSNYWDACFKMMADIDLSNYTYSTALIAPDTDSNSGGFQGMVFTGVFDGNDGIISNLTIDTAGADNQYLGLFGQIGEDAEVKNLGMEDVNITADINDWAYVGSLVGLSYKGNITNCYVTGKVQGGNESGVIGGLVGYNNYGKISDCYAISSVSGGASLGGLLGRNANGGTITKCCSSGLVQGTSGWFGGLVGFNGGIIDDCNSSSQVQGGGWYIGGLSGMDNGGQSINSYATGTVSGGSSVGGLAGSTVGTSNCYATGSVSGESMVGGLMGGYGGGGDITSCYATGNVSGVSDVGGLVGYASAGGQNPRITNSYATGNVSGVSEVGGLVGDTHDMTITSCYASGSVSGEVSVGGLVGDIFVSPDRTDTIGDCNATGSVSGELSIGGLVGNIVQGTINDCYANGNVLGVSYVGGLVGSIGNSDVNKCFAMGNVVGTGDTIGGLAGKSNNGNISNSYAAGSVTGGSRVGGLVGNNDWHVSKCYTSGYVSGDSPVGGLVGYNDTVVPSRYTACFWNIDVNPSFADCGFDRRTESYNVNLDGVIGETDPNMRMESTYANASWDMDSIWDICEGTNYPKFVWQIPVGDFVCPDGVNFTDYSFFADYWLDTNCGDTNDCDGTDFDFSDGVDWVDLKIFCDHWLMGIE